MAIKLKFLIGGIALTPLCLALVIWYRQTPVPVVLFPWSMYSMALRRIALPYDSLGAPWIHEIIIALAQFPIYGVYLGKDAVGKSIKGRLGKLLFIHIGLIVMTLCALMFT